MERNVPFFSLGCGAPPFEVDARAGASRLAWVAIVLAIATADGVELPGAGRRPLRTRSRPVAGFAGAILGVGAFLGARVPYHPPGAAFATQPGRAGDPSSPTVAARASR
jgi:hypothetical protein